MKTYTFISILILFFFITTQAQWVPVNSGTTERLNGVAVINQNEAIAVGKDGMILKSTDQGISWIQAFAGVDDDFNSIVFVDANIGYIAAEESILKSTDGGETWTTVAGGFNGELNELSFAGEMVGFVAGELGYIGLTTNGGSTWTDLNTNSFHLFEGLFAVTEHQRAGQCKSA